MAYLSTYNEYLSVSFIGGPANRFFEYHTATYLAQKWNKTFVFDPSVSSEKGLQHDPCFRITDFFDCETKNVQKYQTKISQYKKNGGINPNWKDDLSRMEVPDGNVLLTNGWYQTFWANHFTIPRLPKTFINFDPAKTLFMHVRRGDYIGSWLDLNLDKYYKNAYKKIRQLLGNPMILICSDEIQWCKDHLSYMKNAHYLDNTDYRETLWLMSRCQAGAILSNSTFGLWGAYLAYYNCRESNPLFKAFMPSQWVGKKHIQHADVGKYIFPTWCEKVDLY